MTDPNRKLAELEETIREQDEAHEAKMRELRDELDDPRVRLGIEALALDQYLDPAAEAIASAIIRLAEMLAELDLISEESPGMPRWRADLGTGEMVDGIEADHRDGRRLYTLDGVDTIVASRLRDDGRFEHAVLNEHGLASSGARSTGPT